MSTPEKIYLLAEFLDWLALNKKSFIMDSNHTEMATVFLQWKKEKEFEVIKNTPLK